MQELEHFSRQTHYGQQWQSIRTIFSLWRGRAPRLLFGALLAVLALFCGLFLMEFSGLRLAGSVLGSVLVATALLRWIGVGRVLLRYAQRLFAHDAMFRALADIRVWFFRSLARGAAAGLGFRRAGDMLSRLVSDISALDGLYLRIVLPLICTILTLPFILAVICSLNLYVGLAIGLVILFAACFLPILMVFIGGSAAATVTQELAQLRMKTLDLVSGLREVCVFGAGERMIDTIAEQDKALFQSQHRQARLNTIARIASYLCSQTAILLLLLAIIGVGAFNVPVLTGIGVLFLLTAVFDSYTNLTQAGAQAGIMGYAAQRVVSAAKTPPLTVKKATQAIMPQSTDISLEDVSFRWTGDQSWILDGCNFQLKAGEHVAIVGPSGAGKSTIAALMMNVVSPQKGIVALGGVDMTCLLSEKIHHKIAWLSQKTHIFADTIRANLLLGNPSADDNQLWQALADASVDSFVKSLPEGLDSWLGEGGINVSGGQGRRIALARTLLMDAPIVILDEPTAALDTDTATSFLRTLNEVLKDSSVLYITHKFYGVEKLDRALCLHDGQLAPLPTN